MEPRNPLNRALEQMSRGNTGTARALCRKVLHHHPDNFDARHLYGVTCLKDGDYNKAVSALREALDLDAPDPQRAQASSNLSLALLQQGQAEKALEAANQAVNLGGEQVPFLGNRANVYEVMADWPAMEKDLRNALEQAPDTPEFLLGLAIACRQQHRLDEALTLLSPLLGDTEADPALVWEWLLIRCLKGEVESALDQSVDLSRQWGRNLCEEVGDYFCENDHGPLALPFYRRAKMLSPEDDALEHRLTALEGRTADEAPAAYIRRLYDTHAQGFEQRLVGRLAYRAPWLLPERLTELGIERFARVLDLGCGTGLAGEQLCQNLRIDYLEGVDLSERMLEKARIKGCYQQLHCAGMLGHLLAAKEPFDLICALDVLIYVGALDALFDAAVQRLHPGGLLAFTVERATRAPFELKDTGRYQHSEQYLTELAAQRNLETLDTQHIPLRMERGQPLEGLMVILRKP